MPDSPKYLTSTRGWTWFREIDLDYCNKNNMIWAGLGGVPDTTGRRDPGIDSSDFAPTTRSREDEGGLHRSIAYLLHTRRRRGNSSPHLSGGVREEADDNA